MVVTEGGIVVWTAAGVSPTACDAGPEEDFVGVQADGKILMLGDGSADFAKKVGLEVDLGPRGMGIRSQRYSMIVENGVVKSLNVEPAPGHDVSSAATMCSLA